MPKLEPYHKKLDYSYALGVFPALNLLEARPEAARRLLINPDGLENEGVDKLRSRCAQLGIREEMAERVLKREAHKENCFAGLVFEKYPARLRPRNNHVVLCQITDGGNLGTALRTLLGFGLKDIAIIRPSVDVFDPRVVRASMGAAFRMEVGVYDSFEDYRALFPEHALYPFMLDGAIALAQAAAGAAGPYALVFGNEQAGLPPHFAQLGTSVVIPHSREIDSLNLAVAVSIGAYAFTHQTKQEEKQHE